MRRLLFTCTLLLLASPLHAAGLLVPSDKQLPPLAMVNHIVSTQIEDQVAVTRIEQSFRNHTDRQLEATYIFPVPKGASVRKFSMWVDGKEVPGELVEADKARKIYTEIVQRTQDPGLLEYMGTNILRLRVFPVLPKSDQKIMMSFTAVAEADNGLVEYVYPLKSDGKAVATLEKFSVNVSIKAQHPLTNIYSPSHAITVTRPTDRHAVIAFEKNEAALDRNFQLFYMAGGKDVGLTTLAHRPSPGHDGHFMLLVSPRAELSKEQQVPRDMVFVLDTSGSMRGKRMTQARNALQYCVRNLTSKDRFGIMGFATTVNKYSEQLLPATPENLEHARKWVEQLEATGGTAINDALTSALTMRTTDETRTFTIVFFTDGRPTIGETDTNKIIKNALSKNTASTRIFTFGVGEDVNASMLDQLADETKAVSSFVNENEDIEAKVSSLYSKISNPVLTNLKLSVGDTVKVAEVYPPQLPDLFHGNQLVVLGRYNGTGHVAIKLTGNVGKEVKEFVYEVRFPDKTGEDKTFVEDLWARRKVGYLLDQIRVNGEKKELVDEVVTLAKRHGITTPYTSYLVVPDAPTTPPAREPRAAEKQPGLPDVALRPVQPTALALPRKEEPKTGDPAKKDPKAPVGNVPPPAEPTTAPVPPISTTALPVTPPGPVVQRLVEDFAKDLLGKGGGVAAGRAKFDLDDQAKTGDKKGDSKTKEQGTAKQTASEEKATLDRARELLARRDLDGVQNGAGGVQYSLQMNNLRNQSQLGQNALRQVYNNRNCVQVGGVWIDDGFKADMKTVTVKALSKAYFRILERHANMKSVYALGNHVVWVTPSNVALIIDTTTGQQEMTDADIDRLFVAPTAKK